MQGNYSIHCIDLCCFEAASWGFLAPLPKASLNMIFMGVSVGLFIYLTRVRTLSLTKVVCGCLFPETAEVHRRKGLGFGNPYPCHIKEGQEVVSARVAIKLS